MPKFDVVIGNPPYQKGDGNVGNPLWPKFSELSVKISKKNGFISLITPATWLNGKGIFKNIFKKYNTIILNINECKKYFSSGNNTFSYWLVQKSTYNNNTTIISKNGDGIEKTNINLDDYEYLPSGWITYSKEVLSIHKKISQFPKLKLLYGPTTSYKLERFVNKKDELHPYKVIYSKVRNIYSSKPEYLQNINKLIFWNTSIYVNKCKIEDCITNDAIGRQVSCIIIPENVCEENVKNIFSGKFYTFCNELYRNGAYFGGYNFPDIDINKYWTDDEIYRYFNLTQEEIDYIESQVK